MGVIKSNKTASKSYINGKEAFNVKISFESEPDIVDKPTEIALILDKSSSMNGLPMEELKKGSQHFVDIIRDATGGKTTNKFEGGTEMALISFSSTATINKTLIDTPEVIKSAIKAIQVGGSTNHKDAWVKANQALAVQTGKKQVMVMFTDGESNAGSEGFDISDLAKNNGVEIYCMGVGDSSKLNITALNRWASLPTDEHVLISPDFNNIEAMFEQLAERITEPKATEITFIDKVNECFEVESVIPPKKGFATILNKHEVKWTLDNIGGQGKELVELEFTVRHTGKCNGFVEVNESYRYNDKEKNTINLPAPMINIVNTTIDVDEDCPTPYNITANGCDDYISYDVGDVLIENTGRILEVSTNIKDVCPNRQVALAVIVDELDLAGKEYPRGMKTILIPAHNNASCIDVKVNCIKFVLPEVLDKIGSPTALCNERKFNVRVLANYVDTDYKCCTK